MFTIVHDAENQIRDILKDLEINHNIKVLGLRIEEDRYHDMDSNETIYKRPVIVFEEPNRINVLWE